MNNKSKLTSYFSALFFVLAIMFSSNINAATAVGGDQNKPKKKKDKHDSIPLDGGLAILVLGAAAFGIKKLRGDKNS